MTTRYDQMVFDPRFEAGFQIKQAQDFKAHLLALRRELALVQFELNQRKARHEQEWCALKYSSDQPRVPAGNPQGGEWTRGGFAADPFNIGEILNQWGSLASDGGLLLQVAAADIPNLAELVSNWLAPGHFNKIRPGARYSSSQQINLALSDLDITAGTSHGLSPHINVFPPIGGRNHFWLK